MAVRLWVVMVVVLEEAEYGTSATADDDCSAASAAAASVSAAVAAATKIRRLTGVNRSFTPVDDQCPVVDGATNDVLIATADEVFRCDDER